MRQIGISGRRKHRYRATQEVVMRWLGWAACALFGIAMVPSSPVEAGPAATMPGSAANGLLRAPDHLLIWSQRPGSAEQVFRDLGFNVRAGQTYPEGIASSTVVFEDWSYLELLHFTASAQADAPRTASERAFAAEGPGANSFAIEVGDIDDAAKMLRKAGFQVGAVEPDMVDPDGPDGPKPPTPARWRDFHFEQSPVAGAEVFFIQYPPDPNPSVQDAAKLRSRSAHTNTARRLSAVWVLVPDLAAQAEVYARMGFRVGAPFAVPHLNGSARAASLGAGSVLLVQSRHLPSRFQPRTRRGPRVLGISIETAGNPLASALPAKYRRSATSVARGPLAPALLVQTTPELGFFVELHGANAPLR